MICTCGMLWLRTWYIYCDNVIISDKFSSNITKEVFTINHRLNCDDKCLVYLLSYKVCGLQYVGQTSDRFQFRWNNYKACQRKAVKGEEHPQMKLHQHFMSENHQGLLSDCEITLIDKTDSSDPTQREMFWIRKLKTLAPLGLMRRRASFLFPFFTPSLFFWYHFYDISVNFYIEKMYYCCCDLSSCCIVLLLLEAK